MTGFLKKDIGIITDEFSLCPATAWRYIRMTEKEIAAFDAPTIYKKRKTVMDD